MGNKVPKGQVHPSWKLHPFKDLGNALRKDGLFGHGTGRKRVKRRKTPRRHLVKASRVKRHKRYRIS